MAPESSLFLLVTPEAARTGYVFTPQTQRQRRERFPKQPRVANRYGNWRGR